MINSALVFLQRWFQEYGQSFYSTDEDFYFHVRLKEEHTARVVKYARQIGHWLTMPPDELALVEIAALLHDVGRFRQYQQYRTFNDALSLNHGELGVQILNETNVLVLAGLSGEQQQLIKDAVLYHNRRQLPENMSEKGLMLAKIIRDADKLDIFSMLVTKQKEHQIPQPPELLGAAEYSSGIIEELLAGHLLEPKAISTAGDLVLFRLSWIYDINFTYSFTEILQKHYIEQLIAQLPNTDDIRRVYHYLKKYAEMGAIR